MDNYERIAIMKIGIAYDTPEMYDFAFSFAGEDRKIVEEIKNYLVTHKYTVFYDNDFQYQLVGKDLYSYLREVYRDKCKYVVCFISENYTKKNWTNLEFTAVKERLISTFFAADFLIPILIGSTNLLEDIPSFIGFYTHKTIIETSQLLINKFESSLVEDNYLFNISNCIKYICENVCNKLRFRCYDVQCSNNVVMIKQYQKTYSFKFSPEENLNLQNILVFYENSLNPELVISWYRTNLLLFDIIYFNKIKSISENLGIQNLSEEIADYIINRLEL